MGLIRQVPSWSHDEWRDYISVNPTRDEVTHYRVDPDVESDNSILKLNTFKDFSSITCLDYSEAEPGLVGVSEKNGFLRLFNVLQMSTDDLQGGKDAIDIKVRAKQHRTINSLSINNNGLVAMGLDRSRNDPSLQIWDVNYQSTNSNIVNPSFSYCSNEAIISLKFIDETNLLASSTKLIKEFDLRAPNPVYQHPSKLSYDIKINPYNHWQFSTFGQDGTLAIWDRRNLSVTMNSNQYLEAEPLLYFEKLVGHGAASRKYMNSCFRWSAVRGSEFATLHNGEVIRRWRLGIIPGNSDDYGSDTNNSNPGSEMASLFVSTVNDITTTYDRVVTFDYIPKENGDSSFICMRQSGTIYRMVKREGISKVAFNNFNGFITLNTSTADAEELKLSSGAQLSITNNLIAGIKNLTFEDLDLSENTNFDSDFDETNSVDQEFNNSDFETDEEQEECRDSASFGKHRYLLKPEKLLQNDISTIMRIRATLGYGLDPMSTVELIDRSKSLQNNAYIRNTWRWIAIAKSSVEDGTMVSGELDLGYEGILDIWNGLEGLSNQNRYKEGSSFTEKQLIKELEKIIVMRGKTKLRVGNTRQIGTLVNTSKPIQRRLCMVISGWDLSPVEIEEKYSNLISLNNYEKAAGWAVFFGDVQKAIEILSSAKKERLRLIATAIAGYFVYKDHPGDNAWRQQCRRLSSELEDPYLRVIFSFIADGDWWDILYENSISLRERLGVALRFLNDGDLTRFLEHTVSTVIASGELEGLILTGITPNGIDLLQSYVSKTSDIQTAALLSLYSCPRYFRDIRVDEWIHCYREMLNSWQLFTIKSKFDVLRTKLSRNSQDEVKCEVRPRQMYIQCLKCNKNINRPQENSAAKLSLQGSGLKVKSTSKKRSWNHTANVQSDTPAQKYSCPHCGTSYPRCAICLLPLGTGNLPIVIGGAVIDGGERTSKLHEQVNESKTRKQQKLNEWFSFCLSCNHGMHAGHAEEWFEKHIICPVPGCSCKCNT
ncbi:HEL037Cp [Eremothecium sinecaudum]|uniref:HEL037Cp n=1 Tax=Eremothecium sinecaudum TaxID=45286 RepID=A0A109V029_9SACH|nr:HEL037Cp [Eremothecium sinecaudum]AMD21243.1 HEL037Cp [Eremothecium sinecaudum]